MYEIPKPRKNAKKVIENPIVKPKRKKVVLNLVQREEIIDKNDWFKELEAVNTYKPCLICKLICSFVFLVSLF